MHAQERAAGQEPRFRATVDLVIVNVAVFDRSGVPMAGLEKRDFRVFDDAEEQQIAVFLTPLEAPLAIVLALDFSESVRPAAPTAREAATTFLHSLSSDDCVFVLPFQSNVARGVWVPGADPEIGRLLGMIPFEGGTALYDAIKTGLDELQDVGSKRRDLMPDTTANYACWNSVAGKADGSVADRRSALVVLTDGNDQHSTAEYPDVLLLAKGAGVPIFPVAIGGAANPWRTNNVGLLANLRAAMRLDELARYSGGMVIRAGREGLQGAYAEVLNVLRASYVIGYHMPTASSESTSERDRWHDIEVTVSRAGVRVHARPGYLAQPPNPSVRTK